MREFVRVRDVDTRHEFDVPRRHPQIGKALEPLNDERWPDLSGPLVQPRPPVFRTDKAGESAPSPAGTPAPKTQKKTEA